MRVSSPRPVRFTASRIPRRWTALAWALLVGLLCVGSAEAAPPRLCVMPLALPFAEGDERRDRVESLVVGAFERGGFEIVPSGVVASRLDAIEESTRHVFDPLTGALDLEALDRLDAARTGVIEAELGCTGRLSISTATVRATLFEPHAIWDGVKVEVFTPRFDEAPTDAEVVLLGRRPAERGWLLATSLHVALSTSDGRDVGFRAGGIEPLVDLTIKSDVDLLPEDRWLRDEARLEAAIAASIGLDASRMRDEGTPTGVIDETRFRWPNSP